MLLRQSSRFSCWYSTSCRKKRTNKSQPASSQETFCTTSIPLVSVFLMCFKSSILHFIYDSIFSTCIWDFGWLKDRAQPPTTVTTFPPAVPGRSRAGTTWPRPSRRPPQRHRPLRARRRGRRPREALVPLAMWCADLANCGGDDDDFGISLVSGKGFELGHYS